MEAKNKIITLRVSGKKKEIFEYEANQIGRSISDILNDLIDLFLNKKITADLISLIIQQTMKITEIANLSKDDINRARLLKELEGLSCLLLKL